MRSKSSIITKTPKYLPLITPGEILKEEFMEPLGLSANMLAIKLKVPANRISEIVNGRRAISANTALRLSRYFGNSAEFWMNLQMNYDLDREKRESLDVIEGSIEQASRTAQ